ncbi:MAG: YfhO family protein [Clostridia bacterium]|nr:YfhO family protein [Clostridia bacterium]
MTMPENTLQKKQSIFKRFFVNNSYCWLACLCTIGVMMLVYYCYDLFPFGDKTILRMDLYHQYGPLFAEFYDRVTNLKSFLYSWQTGLGSPFLGNFFNYLSSPSAIIMLILGHENMPEAIAGMIISKAALAAAAFTYYLKRSQGRHDYTSAAFGVLYAMCGYFIAYYWNVMWIDAMVYFPMVILGIEMIIKHRKPKIYIAFLALTLVSSYYMGYMTCIFSVIYFIIYYFSNFEMSSLHESTPYTLTENGSKKYTFKNKLKGNLFLRSGFTFAFSSLAAAGLVAFALIPTYFILQNCSATSGTFPTDYKSYFSIFDFLANHLASVDPTIRSSGEDVLPNVYCGIATLMLVPLYFFTKSIPLKEKIAHVALLGIFYFSFNTNILNYIWHGFHYPNDLPYRFSFMYSFILLMIAYKTFTRLNEFSGRGILGAGFAVVGSIILIQEIGSKNVEEITILISLIFVVTYCLVFAIMKDKRYQQSAVAVLLLCCVIGEVACANTDRYSMDQPKQNFVGDYSDFRELKELLDEHNGGDDMYRMDLTYNRARMDPAWYGFNGVSTFSSMAYERLSNVQSDLGLYGNYINSYTYHLQTPVYNMMHSLKYVVDNNQTVTVETDYFDELMTVENFTAYENNYYLPIGFGVNSDMSEWYTDMTNPFTVQSDWFEYATGVSDVYGMMNIDEIQYYNMDEITSGLDTGDIYYTKTGSGEGELTFILKTPETKHCYLYVNSSDFDEISITANGEEHTQATDEPYIYDLGVIDPDEEVIVFISIEDSEYGYIDFYPYYINEDKLNEGYEILKSRSLNVESFEETKIKGTVTVDENCMFFTSIPYDTGWSVKVDGVELTEDSDVFALVDAYLCFNLEAGEHTIELTFMPDGLILGAGISALTVIALIVAAIIFKKRREKGVNAPFVPVVIEEPSYDEPEEPVSVELDLPEETAEEESEEALSKSEEETTETVSEDVTEEIAEDIIETDDEAIPEKTTETDDDSDNITE